MLRAPDASTTALRGAEKSLPDCAFNIVGPNRKGAAMAAFRILRLICLAPLGVVALTASEPLRFEGTFVSCDDWLLAASSCTLYMEGPSIPACYGGLMRR